MDSSPLSTPKRKRSELSTAEPPILNTAPFSFQPATTALEDGSNSPRTKVAHKFRGLALDGGGGGVNERKHKGESPGSPEHRFELIPDDHDPLLRKRMKLPDAADTSPSRARSLEPTDAAAGPVEGPKGEWATGLQVAVDARAGLPPPPASRLQHAYPSINRLAESKSRGRKRAGTPPLKVGSKTQHGHGEDAGAVEEDAETEVVDPVRASLTWHDDEITMYDPDDADDDGTGINGIGFKPTPAIAYARALKRKEQLKEYRKREEREARAKRSQRRRGSPEHSTLERKDSASSRRVHFMEVEPSTTILST